MPSYFEEENIENEEVPYVICIYKVGKDDWHQLIINYLNHEKLPKDPKRKKNIRHHAPCFVYYKSHFVDNHSMEYCFIILEKMKPFKK